MYDYETRTTTSTTSVNHYRRPEDVGFVKYLSENEHVPLLPPTTRERLLPLPLRERLLPLRRSENACFEGITRDDRDEMPLHV